MTQTVTLHLPNRLASTIYTIAEQTKRPVEDILVEWLDQVASQLPMDTLDDEQILALTKLQLEEQQQKQLSELLVRSREGNLTDQEQEQLNQLMRIYRQGLLRKAEALKVAVERELVSPLGLNQ